MSEINLNTNKILTDTIQKTLGNNPYSEGQILTYLESYVDRFDQLLVSLRGISGPIQPQDFLNNHKDLLNEANSILNGDQNGPGLLKILPMAHQLVTTDGADYPHLAQFLQNNSGAITNLNNELFETFQLPEGTPFGSTANFSNIAKNGIQGLALFFAAMITYDSNYIPNMQSNVVQPISANINANQVSMINALNSISYYATQVQNDYNNKATDKQRNSDYYAIVNNYNSVLSLFNNMSVLPTDPQNLSAYNLAFAQLQNDMNQVESDLTWVSSGVAVNWNKVYADLNPVKNDVNTLSQYLSYNK